ncbi:MAG: hypothetical protein ACK5N0_06065 [Synechococcaceae cyanobacterium]
MKLFGGSASFALGFQFIADPYQRRPPLRRVSWGQLQILVSGRILTAGISSDQAFVNCAEIPWAAIVEWMVGNWDLMLQETRLPLPSKSAGSAAWCGDWFRSLPDDDSELDKFWTLARNGEVGMGWDGMGSCLPDLRIPDLHLRSVRPGIELSWKDCEFRGAPNGISLHEISGIVALPAQDVADVLFDRAQLAAQEL